jgi:hypothetical protein
MNRYEIQSHCSRMLVKPYSICEQIRLSIVMKLYFYLTGSLALTSTAHKLPTCIPTRSIANSGLRGCVRKLPNSNAAITQWSMLFLLVEQRAAPPLLPSVELITLFKYLTWLLSGLKGRKSHML